MNDNVRQVAYSESGSISTPRLRDVFLLLPMVLLQAVGLILRTI